MTSAPITDVKSLILGNVSNQAKGQEVQNTESFSDVFDKTQAPVEAKKTETKLQKTEDAQSIQNHANIQKNKTSENLKEQEANAESVDVEDMEQVAEEMATTMVKEVANTFEISVEEVEAILEELGLTPVDLLNGENLTKVVLALHPEADALTIMTNEELFADLKGLMNMAGELKNQLAEQFSMTDDEVTNLLNQMAVQMPEDVVAEEVASEVTPSITEAVSEMPMETIPVEADIVEAVTTDDADMAQSKSGVSNSADSLESVDTADGYETTVIPKTESGSAAKRDTSDMGKDGNQNQPQSFSQQVVNQLAERIENATGSSSSYGVNGQEILRQITDHIRVQVNADTTEMELQLHPASLGNVKVQIASTGGVLTAIFTTENEAVKAALESQLVQLKENFTQQGLKVESVEVNVSAQGFERSLDQQEQQEQRQFENTSGRSRNRRIRLNGMEEAEDILAEDMTEDDRIVADMMIRNGNSMDITV